MTNAAKYLSLIKFSHTIFAMPFALIGFVAGLKQMNFEISYWLIIPVILCMIFARSAAMAFNRWADRNIDARNIRTRIREIPSGTISAKAALIFAIMNAAAFIITTWFINEICFYLSPVALLVVLGYSFTKRFTSLSHLVLGLGLSLAPIGAYLAVTGMFNWLPVLFSLAVIGWVAGFDIIYALQDEEFDRENRLFSIPSALGRAGAMRVARILHVTSALTLLNILSYSGFGWIYLAGWLIFTSLLVYQHMIISKDDLSRINTSFFTTNGIASVVFSLFTTFEILL